MSVKTVNNISNNWYSMHIINWLQTWAGICGLTR